MSNSQIPQQIKQANERMNKRIVLLFAANLLLYMATLIATQFTSPNPRTVLIAQHTFPFLATARSEAFMIYAMLVTGLAPFAIAYILRGDPIRERWEFGARTANNRGLSLSRIAFIYLIALPTIAGIASLLFTVDPGAFESSNTSRGASYLQAIDAHPWAAILLVPPIGAGIWVVLSFTWVLLIGPFMNRKGAREA